MEDTGKQKFEGSWREALGGAEATPREDVWAGIEQQLGHDGMKRRVVFYQRLAAASVLFAFLAGAFGFYWRDKHNAQLVELRNSQTNNHRENSNSKTDSSNVGITQAGGNNSAHSDKGNLDERKSISGSSLSAVKTAISTDEKNKQKSQEQNVADLKSKNMAVVSDQNELNNSKNKTTSLLNDDIRREAQMNREGFYGSVSQDIEAAPLFQINIKGGPQNKELIRKLPAMPSAFLNRENEKYAEKWWAAAGASAGSYNPNINNSAFVAPAGAYSNGPSLTPSSVPSNYGTSYSVSVAAAHRVSKRWVLQSGMQYMARSIDYTSNFTSYSGNKMTATVSDYAFANTSPVTVSSPYQLQSRSEYISIPVQAGYLVVDRKFSLLINSGISSDIFLRNTLTDLSGQRASYSEGAGQTSPYRTFIWSALASTELSYKMGTHYRLALVPGMRYSLNQVMKSDQSTQGNPMIWDVGFRFRYIFK